MKSIYVEDKLHSTLKLLASLEGKGLAEVVEECLNLSLRQKMTDIPTEALEKLATFGGSFDYLLDKKRQKR